MCGFQRPVDRVPLQRETGGIWGAFQGSGRLTKAKQPAMCLSSKKYSDKVNACEMKNGAESWAHFEWAWTEAMTLRYATTGITGT